MDTTDFGTTTGDSSDYHFVGILWYWRTVGAAPYDPATDPGYGEAGGFAATYDTSDNLSTFDYGDEEYIIPTKRYVLENESCKSNEQKIFVASQAYCVRCNGKIVVVDEEIVCKQCPQGLFYIDGNCINPEGFATKIGAFLRKYATGPNLIFAFIIIFGIVALLISREQEQDRAREERFK